MKEFDSIRYGFVLDEFLMKLEKIQAYDGEEMQDVLEPLCQLLRVAKITVELVEGIENQRSAAGSNNIVYLDFDMIPDQTRKLFIREITGGKAFLTYTAYQEKGAEDWDPTEEGRIEVMLKMLFAFNGRRRIMSIVDYMTYHDKDLDIYNTTYFMRKLGEYLDREEIGAYGAAFFNLKDFGAINQAIGRDQATWVMEHYAKGLQGILSKKECVCRAGGDKFVVLFLKENFDKVVAYLSGHDVMYDKVTKARVNVSARTGFFMIPEGGCPPKMVMENISLAADAAKLNGELPYVMFDQKLMESHREAKMIENIFPEALHDEEFLVYYQPKVNLKNYRLAGAEALCRWKHDGQLMAPYKFIPVFERSNLICELDFYMLEHVCQDIRRWLDEGKEVVKISVNMSRRHLGDKTLLSQILEIADRYEVPHRLLEIELTETTTDADFADLKEIVCGLQDAGIRTSVDDFGTGYSSMNLIRDLPWNVIKLDKSFLEENDRMMKVNRAMLKHVISMIQEMGMDCIVEGVETAEHVKLLKDNKCYMAQGYHFDKPLPKAEFGERLTEYTRVVKSL